MSERFDVVVVGAGPAGCAAAVAARKHHRKVLLLERGSYPRMKVCGEFVSAESVGRLRQLLRASGEETLVELAATVDKTRIFLENDVITARVDPPAHSIPRMEMDAALWRAALHSGAECRDHCEAINLEGEGSFRLETSAGQVEAEFVIDTSGRWSRVRSAELSTGESAKWIGVKQHFCQSEPADSVDLYFFNGGYCGVQPVDNAGTVNACAMVRADVATQLEKVFEQQERLLQRSKTWRPVGERVFTSPLVFREPSPLAGNVLRAGDAAGFIDPFAGDGIAIALESGFAAGEIAGASQISSQAAKAYEAVYKKRFMPAFRAAARLRQMLELPKAVRWAALKLMKLPGVSERAIRATRARV